MFRTLLTTAVAAMTMVSGFAHAESRIIDLDRIDRIDRIDGTSHLGRDVRTIGQTRLSDWGDVDVIRVSSCSGRDKVHASALKVLVRDDSAAIDALVVTFGNGERQRLNVRENFRKNSESRWIDMAGNVRCIESILVVGEATGTRYPKQAQVIIKALVERDHGGRGEMGVRLIGETRLKDFGRDSDLIYVSRCENWDRVNAAALKIRVTKEDARIDRLRVFYGNGERQELEVRSIFREGTESRWIELRGGTRCIGAVQVVGEAIGRSFGKQAKVSVLALTTGY